MKLLYLSAGIPILFSYIKYLDGLFTVSLFISMPAVLWFWFLLQSLRIQKESNADKLSLGVKIALCWWLVFSVFFWFGVSVSNPLAGGLAEAFSTCGFFMLALHLTALQFFSIQKNSTATHVLNIVAIMLCIFLAVYTETSVEFFQDILSLVLNGILDMLFGKV